MDPDKLIIPATPHPDSLTPHELEIIRQHRAGRSGQGCCPDAAVDARERQDLISSGLLTGGDELSPGKFERAARDARGTEAEDEKRYAWAALKDAEEWMDSASKEEGLEMFDHMLTFLASWQTKRRGT